MNLTPNDAKYLLLGFGILIPFVIAWLPTLKIADYYKFAILAGLSVLGGYLTVVSTEQFVTGGSLIQNAAVVLTAAQVFYYGAFRVLGLEKALFPKQALATEAKEQAKESVPDNLSTEKTKDILDPATSSRIEVTTQVK